MMTARRLHAAREALATHRTVWRASLLERERKSPSSNSSSDPLVDGFVPRPECSEARPRFATVPERRASRRNSAVRRFIRHGLRDHRLVRRLSPHASIEPQPCAHRSPTWRRVHAAASPSVCLCPGERRSRVSGKVFYAGDCAPRPFCARLLDPRGLCVPLEREFANLFGLRMRAGQSVAPTSSPFRASPRPRSATRGCDPATR